jgi:hypothetical protein
MSRLWPGRSGRRGGWTRTADGWSGSATSQHGRHGVSAVVIRASVLGRLLGIQLLRLEAGNKGRLASERGVVGATVAKAAVTGLALGATAYSRALGERLMQAGDAPVRMGPRPPTTRRRIWPGRSGS